MKRIALLVALFGAWFVRRTRPARAISRSLDTLLRTRISHGGDHPVHNILIAIEHPGNGLHYRRAFGLGDGIVRLAEPDDRFKIASITKMMTAVVVLQLFEEGKVDLDEPANNVLKEVDFVDFDMLHRMKGESHGRDITLRHLLNHTSGLPDLFTDSGDFMDHVMKNPTQEYTPETLIDLFHEFGLDTSPVGKPGEKFHYSDTGYILLGLAIEAVTGDTLAAAYRSRIFEPLRMRDSWLEYCEPEIPGGSMAHAFYDRVDVTVNVNTSYDWAGGGVVSTVTDLGRFIRGLFDKRLFRHQRTLDLMLSDPHDNYSLGIRSAGSFFGHFGFWGSTLAYDPERKVTFCLSLNQVNPPFDTRELIEELLAIADGAVEGRKLKTV